MIVILLKGGLGNQMFQYALGRAVSIRNNTSLHLDLAGLNEKNQAHILRNFELNNFNIKASVSSDNFITYQRKDLTFLAFMLNLFRKKKILKRIIEKQFHYTPDLIPKHSDNSYFIGYWNSPKYFSGYEDIIRKDFSFTFDLDERNKEIAEKIRSTVSVSLHIRRGDYVTSPETNAYHGTCDSEYYNKAVDILLKKNKNAVFYIFTDDPEWVKQNFSIQANFVVVSSIDHLNGLQDMYLMTLCKHAIIANSTFSWWSAWLINNPEKTVVAPLKWYNDTSINTSDLFPNSWIRI